MKSIQKDYWYFVWDLAIIKFLKVRKHQIIFGRELFYLLPNHRKQSAFGKELYYHNGNGVYNGYGKRPRDENRRERLLQIAEIHKIDPAQILWTLRAIGKEQTLNLYGPKY